MITSADALEVMTIIAACHHRTAPRLDDEQVAMATAQVWSELLSGYDFTKDELVAAVKSRAKICPDAPEAADVIRVARAHRCDRMERGESPSEPEVASITVVEWERRHDRRFPQLKAGKTVDWAELGNPLQVSCPYCRATVGAPCTVAGSGVVMTKHRAHPSRWDALRDTAVTS